MNALLHLTDHSGYLRNLFCKNCSKLLLLCSLVQAKPFLYSENTEIFLVCHYDSLLKYKNNPFKLVESHTGVEEISLCSKRNSSQPQGKPAANECSRSSLHPNLFCHSMIRWCNISHKVIAQSQSMWEIVKQKTHTHKICQE